MLDATDILLVTCSFLAAYAITGMVPVLPAIHASFAQTPSISYLVSLVVAIVGLSMVVGGPLTSVLVRRFSAPAILIAGFAISGVAAVASAFASTMIELLVARFLQGCGIAAATTIAISLISARNIALIGFHIGSSAVIMLALLPVSGVLGDISWRLSAGLGSVALLYAVAAFALRRALGRISLPTTASGPAPGIGQARTSLWLIGAFALLVGILEYSSPAFLPFVAVHHGLNSAWEISLLTSLTLITSALSSLSHTWLTRHFAPAAVFVLAFGGSGLGAVLIAHGDGTWPLALGALLLGSGGGLAIPHVYACALSAAGPEAKVATAATIRATTFSGLLLGPMALQIVASKAGVTATFWVLAALSLLLLPSAIRIFRNATPLSNPEASRSEEDSQK